MTQRPLPKKALASAKKSKYLTFGSTDVATSQITYFLVVGSVVDVSFLLRFNQLCCDDTNQTRGGCIINGKCPSKNILGTRSAPQLLLYMYLHFRE